MGVLIRIMSVALASTLTSNAVVCMERKRPLVEVDSDDREDRQNGLDVRQRVLAPSCALISAAVQHECYTARRAAEGARRVAEVAASLAATLDGVNERQAELAQARVRSACHDDEASYNRACAHAAALRAADTAEGAYKIARDAYTVNEGNKREAVDDGALLHDAYLALVTAENVRAATTAAIAEFPTTDSFFVHVLLKLRAHHDAAAPHVNPEAIVHLSPADFAFAATRAVDQARFLAGTVVHFARDSAKYQYNDMPDSTRRVCNTMHDVYVNATERKSPKRELLVSQVRTWACRAASAALCAVACAKAVVKHLSDNSPGDLIRAFDSVCRAKGAAIQAYGEAIKCLRLIRQSCKQPLHADCGSAECCGPSLT